MGSPPGFDTLPPEWQQRAREIVADAARQAVSRAERFEFTTYRVAAAGVSGPEDAELLEHLRAVVRVELRARLEDAWPARRFTGMDPEAIVDVRSRASGASAWIEPQAAFVAGRYRKLSREMSQTVLHCRRCKGRGRRRDVPCTACGATGRAVAEAVEDFVRPVLAEALRGGETSFHGSGREDVDVRMLGSGRPFVVAVRRPALRSLDPEPVAARIAELSGGRVEVRDLRVVDRETKRRITDEHGTKTYRVVITPSGGLPLPPDAAQRVARLAGTNLAQRNPKRVPRRADVVRERRVHAIDVESAAADGLVARVVTDPGLYVKEMVSGDEGRTVPSVAELLGVPCVCSQLDVVDVAEVPGGAQDSR